MIGSMRPFRMWPTTAFLVFTILVIAILAFTWRTAALIAAQSPRHLFHLSITDGADVPMRAEFTMTWRRHGVTHRTDAHVIQGARGRFRMEYVSPPEARGRIVYSDGKTQWQLEPRRSLIATTFLVPESPEYERETEDLVAANYRIVLVSSDETTESRPTYLLELLPRQAGKSSQKRWIDRQTFKTLRIETHYPDGILARMIAYTSPILPAAVSPADFIAPQSPGLRRVDSPITSNVLPFGEGAPSVLNLGLRSEGALGFRLMQVASSSVERARTVQLLYSDGIESVSVFVQNGGSPVLNRDPGWHAITIDGHSAFEHLDGHLDAVVWTHGVYRYTAVSHLEPQALQRFVASQFAAQAPSSSSSTHLPAQPRN